MSLTAIVLTKNEAGNINTCLDTLLFADERIVVDAGSQDQTIQLAQSKASSVYFHEFVNFADQRNYSLVLAKMDWVLFIDADERVSLDLAREIQSATEFEPAAYAIPRHNYFFGKRLRYSGSAEDAPVRLFPKNSGVWKQPVHEYFETPLPIRKLKEPLIHHTTRDLAHYMEKVERYVPLEVETMLENGRSAYGWDLIIRPFAKFLYLYLCKLGVLDGVAGLQYAVLSAYYDFRKYRAFLKSKKELRK